jgi:hypothetical protein
LHVEGDVLALKQLIKKQLILKSGAVESELVLPGEPIVYSIKYDLGRRRQTIQYFQSLKWTSIFKSCFQAYLKTNIPVVIVVRFYVTPPEKEKIKRKDLLSETIPAVHSNEVCDYLLSFLELFLHVLINSYRQIVKLDVEKYYSANPRTVFKFMKWDYYVQLKNKNTIHTET